jgi:hypothetical protein
MTAAERGDEDEDGKTWAAKETHKQNQKMPHTNDFRRRRPNDRLNACRSSRRTVTGMAGVSPHGLNLTQSRRRRVGGREGGFSRASVCVCVCVCVFDDPSVSSADDDERKRAIEMMSGRRLSRLNSGWGETMTASFAD